MLRDLYQEVILDHNRSPRNCHEMDDATSCANGVNPLCGDKLTLYIKVADDKILDISFIGSGCAISTASASLLTDSLKGKSVAEARDLFSKVHASLTEDGSEHVDLGKLAVLLGVKEFPARVKCATLAWHTLVSALDDSGATASTE